MKKAFIRFAWPVVFGVLACMSLGGFNGGAQAQQPVQPGQAGATALSERIAALQETSRALQPAQREQAQEFFALGFKLFQEGAFDASRLGFERGLNIDPGNGQARFYLGETLSRLKQGKLAKEQFELALALAPNTAEGLKAEIAIANLSKTASISAMNAGTVFRDCEECPEMVVIPAGNFTMGAPASEAGAIDWERPQHQVRISKPFAVGKFEVTFDEWDECVRDRGCNHSPSHGVWSRGRLPVINVSWLDAKAYTDWLSRKSGKTYRLLSESEWEYVARAGTTTAFSTGSRITPQQANYATNVSYAGSPVVDTPRKPVEVGSYAANAFGLHDVHGNVTEWTEDCWHGDYRGAPADGSAWNSGECATRVLRGFSWSSSPAQMRSASRGSGFPDTRANMIGFRVARTH